MARPRWFTASVVVVLAGIAMLAPAQASAGIASAPLLFLQEAQSGTLTPAKGGGFTLVLNKPNARVVAFTDRPTRQARSEPLKTFVSSWTSRFSTSDPNAAIELSDEGKHQDVLVVTLGKPTYDARANTVTYRARALKGKGSAGIKEFVNRADKRLPRSFGHVDLFIDPSDQDPGRIEINVVSASGGTASVIMPFNTTLQGNVSFSSTGAGEVVTTNGGVIAFNFSTPINSPVTIGTSFDFLPAPSKLRLNVTDLPAGASLTASYQNGTPVTTSKTGFITITKPPPSS
jgi:hypothetical protein